jgi:hypothetical protein
MENQIIPLETEQVQLVKGLTFFRRLREHGTRTEQYLLQLPKDLLDQTSDTRTDKRFKINLGFNSKKERIILINLDNWEIKKLKKVEK